MKKYLVTGGCGFIGSHLVELLLERGYSVRVLDDLSNSTTEYLPQQAEFIEGSITDEQCLKKATHGVSGIFHLAALVSVADSVVHRYKHHVVNCGGTVRLFEHATVPVVLASSAAVYGEAGKLPIQEETPLCPLSPYAVDKLSSEMHARLAWQFHRTPSIILRFFNVYGPRQNPLSPYSGVISKFIHQIVHKKAFTIFGDGNQRRDFIFVKDVANLLLQAMEQAPFQGSQTYNLCTGVSTSINELATLLQGLMNTSVKKEYVPARDGEIFISQGDPSKALRDLNLKAETTLKEGLKQIMQNIS